MEAENWQRREAQKKQKAEMRKAFRAAENEASTVRMAAKKCARRCAVALRADLHARLMAARREAGQKELEQLRAACKHCRFYPASIVEASETYKNPTEHIQKLNVTM